MYHDNFRLRLFVHLDTTNVVIFVPNLGVVRKEHGWKDQLQDHLGVHVHQKGGVIITTFTLQLLIR